MSPECAAIPQHIRVLDGEALEPAGGVSAEARRGVDKGGGSQGYA